MKVYLYFFLVFLALVCKVSVIVPVKDTAPPPSSLASVQGPSPSLPALVPVSAASTPTLLPVSPPLPQPTALPPNVANVPNVPNPHSPINIVQTPPLVANTPTLVAPTPISGMVPIRNPLYDQAGLTSSVLLQPLNEVGRNLNKIHKV